MNDDLRRTVERQAARLQPYCLCCGREIAEGELCSDCEADFDERDAAADAWREQMARRESGGPMMRHMDIYGGE